MTVLPKQIQAQLDEADRLMQVQDVAAVPQTPDPEPPPPPAPEPAAAPQPAPQHVDPPQDADYWKRRFDILQGKYNSEVPELLRTARESQQLLARVQEEVETLRTQRATQPAPQQPEPLVTKQDEQTFGADLVDMARRVSREELGAVDNRLRQLETAIRTIAPKAERVAQVEQQVAQSREGIFYSELGKAVADWEQVNVDPRWLQWLQQYDPVAGRTRQASLDEASGKFDYQRVIGMFQMFKQTLPTAPSSNQSELARQVAPSRSSTTTTTPPGERVFSGAEYHHWLDPRRVYDTDKKQLENMITELERAVVEGRVRW